MERMSVKYEPSQRKGFQGPFTRVQRHRGSCSRGSKTSHDASHAEEAAFEPHRRAYWPYEHVVVRPFREWLFSPETMVLAPREVGKLAGWEKILEPRMNGRDTWDWRGKPSEVTSDTSAKCTARSTSACWGRAPFGGEEDKNAERAPTASASMISD